MKGLLLIFSVNSLTSSARLILSIVEEKLVTGTKTS